MYKPLYWFRNECNVYDGTKSDDNKVKHI